MKNIGNLGNPTIVGTGGEIEKTGLYDLLQNKTPKPLIPKYNRKTIEDAFSGIFINKIDPVNDEKYKELVKLQTSCTYINTSEGVSTLHLSGKEIYHLHKNYLSKVIKFVKIWETQNHLKRLSVDS